MKRIVLPITAALVLNTSLFAKAEKKVKYLPKDQVINLLKVVPNSHNIINDYKNRRINIYVEKKDGFYIVMIKGNRSGEFFISENKKYAIFGTVVDLKTKKPVKGDFPLNKKVIKDGVAFTYGVGKKNIYLVTDPQCPYCRMLENKKGDELLKEYKIHVIIFPLPFHKYAIPMTEYILAGKNNEEKAARLRRILHGSNEWKNFHPTAKEKAKIDKEIQKMQRAANELGARGTPSVYDDNFKPISLRKIYNQK